MEVVRVFNNELSSLYEVKPPISKAKMTQITKSAIKGLKFYKHIVQSVEKFIQKCRPEYKVPGLYVVDSIVRQSRHQFGADKDVFGPRFVKNISITFQHLFKCPEDDRPKIIRVLNLWQKNTVFPSEIIQPLLDMGHPNSTNEWPLDTPADTSKDSPRKTKEESKHKSDSWKGWPQGNDEAEQENKTFAEMSTKNLEKFNKVEMSNAMKEDESSRSGMHRNQIEITKPPEETVKFNQKLLDFDYGDEEDEEDVKNEESNLSNQPNALALSMAQNLLSNPELLRQLQQMTASTIQQTEALKDVTHQAHSTKVDDNEPSYPQEMQSSPQIQIPLIPPTPYQQPVMQHNLHLSKSENDTDDRVLPEQPLPTRDLDERSLASVMASHDRLLPSMCLPTFQTGVTPNPSLPDKDDRIIPDPAMPPRDLDERSLASIIAPPERPVMPPMPPYPDNSNLMQFQYDKNNVPFQAQPVIPTMDNLNMNAVYPVIPPAPHLLQNSQADEDDRVMYSMPGEPPLPPQDFDERQIMLPVEERGRKERSRSRSGSRSRGRSGRHRSRSRSPRRKRSRSRSRPRKNRSHSMERERIREKERERERERERRRKGIPPTKKGCVSVCSTTLWLGHVPKACSEPDISETFEPFGTILSIDMIPPRGCAYVVMDRRQDGYRALQKLKNLKLHGSSVKMAWAPGKGVKGKEYKEYWEVDLGVSYVPCDKIKEDPEALELLEEGGFIDEDSLPDHLKALRKQSEEEKQPFNTINKTAAETSQTFSEIQAAPNMVPPPIMPPSSVGLPMVLPHLMTPQFGLPLPGMLPPQAMVMQVPMGIPPPAPMLMVQQQSQGIMGTQSLSMVGGVPQMVPRTIPPATTALPNLKSVIPTDLTRASAAIVPPTTTSITPAGDATPTEEDGTSVSSPSVQATISSTISAPSLPVVSTQPIVSMAQFNPVLALSANRSMLSVPPPVSTAGTPIPYPPPTVGFNFPPPGIRPPGQAPGLPHNPQFSWMQKRVSSPFTDADSGNSTVRPVPPPPPPQSTMPMHLFNNRPPFHESQISNVNSSPIKDARKARENIEQKSNDADNLVNKNLPPTGSSHDKMPQDMVMNTDDESSMDTEYSRSDVHPSPYFPGGPEFSRAPLNMQRMRGPIGPMQPGPRFPRGMHMGSPFPMRMVGPRGIPAPGMHNRMDIEFPPHHGPHGPRMPMGPHGPRRNDNIHPPHDGRDWYPRDFEGPPPPHERERDRHFRDDWNRETWPAGEAENDPRRNSRDHKEVRRDDHQESWNRDHSENSKPSRDSNSASDRKEFGGKQKEKPINKSKANKSLLNDLIKLKSYRRNAPTRNASDQSKEKSSQKENKEEKESDKPCDINKDKSDIEKHSGNGQIQGLRKEKERENRKRSRWGRTLSEEREFQEQRRNEIEMKLKGYEQSHVAQQPVQSDAEIPDQSSNEVPNESTTSLEPFEPSEANPVNTPVENLINPPGEKSLDPVGQNPTDSLEQNMCDEFAQNMETSGQNIEVSTELVIENPIENFKTSSEETHLLNDFQTSSDLDATVSQSESESLSSSKLTDNFSHETSVIENVSACVDESLTDLGGNSAISNCTLNENEVVEVNSNNSSLVSTES